MATAKNNGNTRGQSVDAGNASEGMQRFHPNSRANRIAALEVGDSISEARRLDIDESNRDTIMQSLDELKSTLSKAAYLATQRSGSTFITEVGQFFTRSGDIIVTAVVTRTA